MKTPPPTGHWTVELGALAGVGTTIAAATTLGILAGQWADEKWGLSPWLTVTGAFLGFGAGIVNLVRAYEYFTRTLGQRPAGDSPGDERLPPGGPPGP